MLLAQGFCWLVTNLQVCLKYLYSVWNSWPLIIPTATQPASNFMFKLNNRNTRTKCEICSRLTIKTPERPSFWCLHCWLWTYFAPCSNVSIVNLEHAVLGWVTSSIFGYFCFRGYFGVPDVKLYREWTCSQILPKILLTSIFARTSVRFW